MTITALPPRHERDRLAALHRLDLLTAPPDQMIGQLVELAARTLDAPMAAMTLVDSEHLHCVSTFGFVAEEAPRATTFCDQVVVRDEVVVMGDASVDPRFAANPFVVGPAHIRFYAGAPLHASGQPIGALCVMDRTPREVDAATADMIRGIAACLESLLDQRTRAASCRPPTPARLEVMAAAVTDHASFLWHTAAIGHPAWIYDAASLRVLAVNPDAVATYGWTEREWCERTILDIRPIEDAVILEASIRNQRGGRTSPRRRWRHCRANGQVIDVHISSCDVWYEGTPARLVIATDITEHLDSFDIARHATLHDDLTGLVNRRQFHDAVAAMSKPGSSNVDVIVVGLDRFKLINDSAGHDVGDAILSVVATRIVDTVGESGVVARVGGDEFAVALYGRCDRLELAHQVCEAVRSPIEIRGAEYHVTASVGVASCSNGTATSLLEQASTALAAAKRSVGRGVVVFDDEMHRQMVEWSDVANDLHQAVERKEFDLDFQPLFDRHLEPVAMEALVRWNHPSKGRLMPGTFLEVAEETGMMSRVGRWVLDTAAETAARLDITVSVNMSIHQLNDSLVSDVQAAIARHALRPGQLVVEVTESALADGREPQRVIAALRAAGARIWIDDFGTGYSSLGRLHEFPFDAIKLDRSFVDAIDTEQGRAIVKAVVSLAEGLGVDVIAEGVERLDQLQEVTLLGATHVQGYLLSRPVSADVAGRLLRELGAAACQGPRPDALLQAS